MGHTKKRPEASGSVQKCQESSGSTRKDTPENILPHFHWNADFIPQSSSHILLKILTAEKCSGLWKTSFHCFRQNPFLVWANN